MRLGTSAMALPVALAANEHISLAKRLPCRMGVVACMVGNRPAQRQTQGKSAPVKLVGNMENTAPKAVH